MKEKITQPTNEILCRTFQIAKQRKKRRDCPTSPPCSKGRQRRRHDEENQKDGGEAVLHGWYYALAIAFILSKEEKPQQYLVQLHQFWV